MRKDLVEIVDYIFNAKGGDALLFSSGTRWTRTRCFADELGMIRPAAVGAC